MAKIPRQVTNKERLMAGGFFWGRLSFKQIARIFKMRVAEVENPVRRASREG